METLTRLWQFETKGTDWKAEVQAAIAAWQKRGLAAPVLLEVNPADAASVSGSGISVHPNPTVSKRYGMFHFKQGGD